MHSNETYQKTKTMLFRKLKKKLLLKHKKTKEKPLLHEIEDLNSDASVDLDKLDKKRELKNIRMEKL